MRYLTKLTLSFLGLLSIALISAGLAFWSARTAQNHLERSHLAYEVQALYLRLSSHTVELFKQFGDAFLIGARDGGEGEALLLAEIRRDLEAIRRRIGEEVQLVGEEEIEELQTLAQIEGQLNALLREFSALRNSQLHYSTEAFAERLTRMLDQQIDGDFKTLIAKALLEEREEVEETQAELTSATLLFKRLALAAGFIAAVTALLGVFFLRRSLTRPIQRLLVGATSVGQGDLSHRIETPGDSELDRVAQAFNQMTAKVAERQDYLSASRDALEEEVSSRTAQLEKLLATLRETEANRRRLLADVSHELRTPLTIIRGEADVALRKGERSSEEYREVLRRTREAADHTTRIVDDLLFVARQENGEVRIRLRETDLRELLEHSVEAGQALGDGSKAVLFETSVDQALVPADPGRIGQVIHILLENALLYGGQEILVRLDRSPDGFAVTVMDDGPGLTESELEHVFERFFRGSNAALRYDSGSGLGLPVAKAIVEAHGGKIVLESALGSGVQARFTLPQRTRLAAAS